MNGELGTHEASAWWNVGEAPMHEQRGAGQLGGAC